MCCRISLGWNNTVGLSKTTVKADVRLTDELLRAAGFVVPMDVVRVDADVEAEVEADVDGTDALAVEVAAEGCGLNPDTNHGNWEGGRIKGDTEEADDVSADVLLNSTPLTTDDETR